MSTYGLSPEAAWKQFDGIAGLEHYPSRLLGVRGYDQTVGQEVTNRLNIYDDLITICDGPGTAINFRASVDPGDYYLKHPLNPKGCAQLRCGLYWFTLGIHTKGNHPCLVQASSVNLDRLNSAGEIYMPENQTWAGIQFHSGGDDPDVEMWSAGCQIIFCPEGAWGETWEDFMETVANIFKRTHLDRIPYLLIDKLKPLDV